MTHASNNLKDSCLQTYETLHGAVEVFQRMGFSVEFPLLGFIPLPFHPPKNILLQSLRMLLSRGYRLRFL